MYTETLNNHGLKNSTRGLGRRHQYATSIHFQIKPIGLTGHAGFIATGYFFCAGLFSASLSRHLSQFDRILP